MVGPSYLFCLHIEDVGKPQKQSTIYLIQYVLYDLSDGNLYEPLPCDHYSVGLAMKTFNTVADAIGRVIDSQEPYEISIVG